MCRIKEIMTFIVLATMTFVNTPANAQQAEQDTSELHYAPFHFAFVTPLSTNGIHSYKTVNNVSLNLLYGHSAGVKGVELGTFLNISNRFVKGFQAAGFTNLNLGSLNGVQAANFGNLTNGDAKGAQGAGFANVTVGNFSGFQGSGFINVTTKSLNGIQAAGFFNYAKKVNGVQLGFINVADSFQSGVPIGFLSVAANGYNHVEAWGSDAFHANLSGKFGVHEFYNIFTVGKQFGGDLNLWGIGYGIGTYWPIKKGWGVNVDLLAQDVNKMDEFLDGSNTLHSLKINANFKIGDFELFAGPALKVLRTDQEETDSEVRQGIEDDIGPDGLYETTKDGYHIKGWIGGNLGIRY